MNQSQTNVVNELMIRKILKQYDIKDKSRVYLFQNLNNRRILSKSIRNNIYSQFQQVDKAYCLIKGSVQILYQFKEKNKKKKNNKSHLICQIDNSFQILNEQIILKMVNINQANKLINQANKLINVNEKLINMNKKLTSINELNQNSNQTTKKTIRIKSNYTATITSSQCQYIELSLYETKLLLQNNISLITKKQQLRQNTIKQRQILPLNDSKQLNSTLMSKLLLPNISLKNIHPANEIYQRNQNNKMYLLKQQQINIDKQTNINKIKEDKIYIKQQLNQSNPEVNKNTSKNLSNSKVSKNLQLLRLHRSNSQVHTQSSNRQANNEHIGFMNQNENVLQKYRCQKDKQQRQISSKRHKSLKLLPVQNKIQLIKKNSRQIYPKSQNSIFKQHLKSIIKRKIKFERKYGQTLKDMRIENNELTNEIVNGKSSKLNRYDRQYENGHLNRQYQMRENRQWQIKARINNASQLPSKVPARYNQNGLCQQNPSISLYRARLTNHADSIWQDLDNYFLKI